MDTITFPVWIVVRRLENHLCMTEAIEFPEFVRLGETKQRTTESLDRLLVRLLEETPLEELHRRAIAEAPVGKEIEVSTIARPGSVHWRQPLRLRFFVLRWNHGSSALAFLPALGLKLIADKSSELEARMEMEIRVALTRIEAITLPRLSALQRELKASVESSSLKVNLRSPKMRVREAKKEAERTPSILASVAVNLAREAHTPTLGLEPLVEQLADLLTARSSRGVLLVGPSGVGKTAAVRELVQQRAARNLGTTPFWMTSGSRLVAGMSGFGMWQERCLNIVREATRTKAVLHLGNIIELMEVGKYEGNSVSIASFLRPYIARGELSALAECTPEQLPIVEREDPHLLAAFQQVVVLEPEEVLGKQILAHFAENTDRAISRSLSTDSLETLDRLHRRYATYSAYPGRPLRFLFNLLHDHRDIEELTPTHVLDAFTRETGLPRVLLDPLERLDLKKTLDWFQERVIGQPESAELIVSVLASTKAGLNRPRKPIASLLFIGPTGVGKTEMAKSLAEFLFGSNRRLTRFDMSEYNDPVSVQRLVGGVFGSEGLLTAKVREQPFGILLFDEFEKAHPLFYDLLLQVLGEGRLTDASGRLADFCNTVIILTSNLGADTYKQGAFGFGSETEQPSQAQREAAREHFVREVQKFLRPELFNRIDRVVAFAPLEAATIATIAERHLHRLELRDGIRYRGTVVQMAPEVASFLARMGHDFRYGARPLLRVVERRLLAPLADQMNRYSAEVALQVQVDLQGSQLKINVKPRQDEAGRVINSSTTSAPLSEASQKCVEQRRLVQSLLRSPRVREFRNELFRLDREQQAFERLQHRFAVRKQHLANCPEPRRSMLLGKEPKVTSRVAERMTKLARLKQVEEKLDELNTRITGLEDRALQSLYALEGAKSEIALNDVLETVERVRKQWLDLLLTLYSRDFPDPNLLSLVCFSEDTNWLIKLASAYFDTFAHHGYRVGILAFRLPRAGKGGRDPNAATPTPPDAGKEDRLFWHDDKLLAPARPGTPELMIREPVEELSVLDDSNARSLLGLGFNIRGSAAVPRFLYERGLHTWRPTVSTSVPKCLVETCEAELFRYIPPEEIARKGAIGSQTTRRIYDERLEIIDDLLLGEKLLWRHQSVSQMVLTASEKLLQKTLQRTLES